MTDAQDDAVRRLLADARHDQPIPPQVSDRMDQVIADLAAERSSPDNVVTLRRRWLPALLLAAAAVVAIGFGVSQMIPTSSDQDAATSAESNSAPESDQDGAVGDSPKRGAAPDKGAPESLVDELASSVAALPALEEFDKQSLSGLRDGPELVSSLRERVEELAQGCGPLTPRQSSEIRYARLDSALVVVVFTDGPGATSQAKVYKCSSGNPRVVSESVLLRSGE